MAGLEAVLRTDRIGDIRAHDVSVVIDAAAAVGRKRARYIDVRKAAAIGAAQEAPRGDFEAVTRDGAERNRSRGVVTRDLALLIDPGEQSRRRRLIVEARGNVNRRVEALAVD